MAVLRSAPSVSRRTALTAFGAAGLGLSLGSLVHQAWAQDATPKASEITRNDHPLYGVWEWTVDLHHKDHPSPIIFSRDGTCLEYDRAFGVGIGFWRITDAQRGEMVMQYQELAVSWLTLRTPVALFDADHVPETTTFVRDFYVTRCQLAVDDTAEQLICTGELQIWSGGANPTPTYVEGLSRQGKRLST